LENVAVGGLTQPTGDGVGIGLVLSAAGNARVGNAARAEKMISVAKGMPIATRA